MPIPTNSEGGSKRKRAEGVEEEYTETPAEAERRRNKKFQEYCREWWVELSNWTNEGDVENVEDAEGEEDETMKE